jgi:hypothetical protein
MLLALHLAKGRERRKNDLGRKPEYGFPSLMDWRPNSRISNYYSIFNTERGYGLALHDEDCRQKLWWTQKSQKGIPSMLQVCERDNACGEIQLCDLKAQIPLTRLRKCVDT